MDPVASIEAGWEGEGGREAYSEMCSDTHPVPLCKVCPGLSGHSRGGLARLRFSFDPRTVL